uniref:Uncharacterized protein n=1 Tax=Arundo donax TaxID=35708 RepID=A0A0A9CDL3_ARUDO
MRHEFMFSCTVSFGPIKHISIA